MVHDPTASSAVAADWLVAHPPAGPVLTIGDAGPVGDALDRLKLPREAWVRLAHAGAPATAWCPDGPFATAVVHWPKGRDAQRMVVHVVAARLAPGGTCWVHGHNEEGIKSAEKVLREAFGSVQAVEARRHCRLWSCTQPLPVGNGAIDDWSTEHADVVATKQLRWRSWPGLFAHGRVDDGTEILVRSMPALAPGARVLDWGCGAGVLALGLLARNPGIAIDLLDIDALAVHAARVNVPEAGDAWVSDGWIGLPPDRRWNVIATNPPWHAGVSTDWTALLDLIRVAPERLVPGGELWMVTRRELPVGPLLERGFARVRIVESRAAFRVWAATTKASTPG